MFIKTLYSNPALSAIRKLTLKFSFKIGFLGVLFFEIAHSWHKIMERSKTAGL